MFPNVWNYKRNSTNVRNQCLKLSQCLNLGAKLNPITASVVSWSALARTQLHCKVFKWYKWHIIQNTRWNSTESNHKVHASQILPEFMQAAQRDDHPLWSLAFKLRFESFLIFFKKKCQNHLKFSGRGIAVPYTTKRRQWVVLLVD